MRIGCDTKQDAEELLRAVHSWLNDPARVITNGRREDASEQLAELRLAVDKVREVPR